MKDACEGDWPRLDALRHVFCAVNGLDATDSFAIPGHNDTSTYEEVKRAWDRTIGYLRGEQERKTDISVFEAMLHRGGDMIVGTFAKEKADV
jgi:hypothetical protein